MLPARRPLRLEVCGRRQVREVAGGQAMEGLWIYSKGEGKLWDGFEQALVCSELCFKELIVATLLETR